MTAEPLYIPMDEGPSQGNSTGHLQTNEMTPNGRPTRPPHPQTVTRVSTEQFNDYHELAMCSRWCCRLLGSLAIRKSDEARIRASYGDMVAARHAAEEARRLANQAITIGSIMCIVATIMGVVVLVVLGYLSKE
ncbi:uncharacterized protein [Apostichopus japonicus]|uniref:uncharacterized protein isoform X2 n=1 Tax=Stichopus japonicus TaxID=307972 RepID=UPI003AB7C949